MIDNTLHTYLFSGNRRFWLIYGALFILALACTPSKKLEKPAVDGKSVEPAIRVGLTNPTNTNPSLRFEGNYTLDLEEARYQLDASVGKFEVVTQESYFELKGERRYFNIETPATLTFRSTDATSKFVWNDIAYSGDLTLIAENGRIQAVNRLPVEQYLLGVVPNEIPSKPAEHRAAVFAQTIAARSYALNRMESPATPRFDVWADERDQVYRGVSNQTPQAAEAVQSTRGMVLTEGTRPVSTQYHASSGGVLERLPAAIDSLNPRPQAIVAYDVTDGQPNDQLSPYYRWVETRSAEAILQNLQRERSLDPNVVNGLLENGFVMTMDVAERSESGRVRQLNIMVDGQLYPFSGLAIRRVLGDAAGKPLPSNLFFLKISPSSPDNFYIVGAGAGHGRGMSQWGAIGLSIRGYSYENILSFYYPNLLIKKIY